MWARIIELVLASWLAVSPYVFGHDPSNTLLWIVDYGAALVVGALALLSFHRRLYRAHVGTLFVAVGLVALAFLVPEGDPPAAAYQNHMGTGLLLLMFAAVPSESDRPPRRWEEFLTREPARRAGDAS